MMAKHMEKQILTNDHLPRLTHFFHLLFLLLLISLFSFNSSTALSRSKIDYGVLVVGDQLITYQDVVRIALIEQVFDKTYQRGMESKPLVGKNLEKAVHLAMCQSLVSQHLQRLGRSSEISKRELEAEKDRFKTLLGGPDQTTKLQRELDLTDHQVEILIQRRVQVELFFQKSAAFQKEFSDNDAKHYFDKNQQKKFYGKKFGELKSFILAYLKRTWHEDAVKEWLKNQKERIEVKRLAPIP
jgi:hypothetical protein